MKTILQSAGTGSFLKDAIRDLVVVVVGILAALWLEAWWQDVQDRKEEAVLLIGLREEFVANRAQLADHIETWKALVASADRAVTYFGRPVEPSEIKEAKAAFGGSLEMRFFDPRQGQLSSLINSGKLSLVEDPSLRAKIADWPGLVGDLDVERDIALYSVTEGYVKELGRYVAMAEQSPFDDDLEALRSDREVYNSLRFVGFNARRLVSEGTLILEATDEIIALIDDKLGTSE